MTMMMVEAAIMIRDGHPPQWTLPENAEFIAHLLGMEAVPIVPIEYMPELNNMADQIVIVPIVEISAINGESADGGATVAWASTWRLGAVATSAALVANLAPDEALHASQERKTMPLSPIPSEATGVAYMVKGNPGSEQCEFILVGNPQRAVNSMNRMIEREFSLADGLRVCAEAMRAAANSVPEMPAPDSLMRRLEMTASTVLAFSQSDNIVLSVSPQDGQVRVSVQGRPSAQSSPVRRRR